MIRELSMTRNVIFKYSLLSLLAFGFFSSGILSLKTPNKPLSKLQPILIVENFNPSTVNNDAPKKIKDYDNFLLYKLNNEYHFLHSLEELATLNKTRFIDAASPLYEKLFIGKFDKKSNKMNYHPLNNSYIRAIKLSSKMPSNKKNIAEVITPHHYQEMNDLQIVITDRLFLSAEINKISPTV